MLGLHSPRSCPVFLCVRNRIVLMTTVPLPKQAQHKQLCHRSDFNNKKPSKTQTLRFRGRVRLNTRTSVQEIMPERGWKLRRASLRAFPCLERHGPAVWPWQLPGRWPRCQQSQDCGITVTVCVAPSSFRVCLEPTLHPQQKEKPLTRPRGMCLHIPAPQAA